MTDRQNSLHTLSVVAFAGSLRRKSYNRGLLRAARELAPERLDVKIYDLADIQLYNRDVEQAGVPDPVRDLARAVDEANAVLIVTPEYNAGLPGVLKNTIDWLSRSSVGSPLKDKPVGMMGATPGRYATGRAQEHLKLALLAVKANPYVGSSVAIAGAGDKFEDAELVDESSREFVATYMERFDEWLGRQILQTAERDSVLTP